ncbi:MAG: aspartyl-phosphate phosphatase Spo0E family protein [Syntrophomonas sp.]
MDVINRIEKLRLELHRLATEKGFQDPQVIEVSGILDELINEYYWLEQLRAKRPIAS